jgi:hypothetical protein
MREREGMEAAAARQEGKARSEGHPKRGQCLMAGTLGGSSLGFWRAGSSSVCSASSCGGGARLGRGLTHATPSGEGKVRGSWAEWYLAFNFIGPAE